MVTGYPFARFLRWGASPLHACRVFGPSGHLAGTFTGIGDDMFAVGDRVDHEGREAIVTAIIGGAVPTYQLRYLARLPVPQGRNARAEKLELLPPLSYEVGQQVSIAGIRGRIVEELPDGRYKVAAETGDQRGKGYSHRSEWNLRGWQLALD